MINQQLQNYGVSVLGIFYDRPFSIMKRSTIVIADKHKLLSEILGMILNKEKEFAVVLSCSAWEDAVGAYKVYNPDIIIMDTDLIPFNRDGQQVFVPDYFPHSKVVALHGGNTENLLETGFCGYLEKTSPLAEMIPALKEMVYGNNYRSKEQI
jgi:DNA-binding NarL/FixJ family response regulator